MDAVTPSADLTQFDSVLPSHPHLALVANRKWRKTRSSRVVGQLKGVYSKLRNAKNGTYNGEKTYCPAEDCECPYYNRGVCYIDDPVKDCDEWKYFYPNWEDYENDDGI